MGPSARAGGRCLIALDVIPEGCSLPDSVNVPIFGEFAAPEVFAGVARRAEEAGWDALLVWDHVAGEKDRRWQLADPWILLAAAALATRRIRLGTAITPVARRRPSKLAREVTTLDRLTGGRMILGAGPRVKIMGVPAEGHGRTDRKIASDLPALRDLPTGISWQIRKPRCRRPSPPCHRVDRPGRATIPHLNVVVVAATT